MNGKPLPPESPDMKAMVAYFDWMKRETKPDGKVPGRGVGKIDRKKLPTADFTRVTDFVAPRTQLESVIADVFAQTLGLERVSVHDGFFELGGNSLLSIQCIAQLEERGLRLRPKWPRSCCRRREPRAAPAAAALPPPEARHTAAAAGVHDGC